MLQLAHRSMFPCEQGKTGTARRHWLACEETLERMHWQKRRRTGLRVGHGRAAASSKGAARKERKNYARHQACVKEAQLLPRTGWLVTTRNATTTTTAQQATLK